MSRARSVAGLCRRAATALGQRSPTPLPTATAGAPRTVVATTAAAAGALTSGTMMRVFGVDIPYSYVIGTAFVVGIGAYTYETLVLGKEGHKVVKEEVTRHPDITSLSMTNQEGKPFTAQQLLGKWALMDFGSIHSADVKGINSVCRAAEAAQQRTGVAITPVFLSLDPRHDKPADLKRVASAAGHPGLVALTGNADGVLECAHKFKSQQKAAVLDATRGDEQYKKGEALVDDTYVSSFVYLVAPNGEFARLWPKDVSIALLSDAVARAVKE